VAAMAPNSNLRSSLIRSTHDQALISVLGSQSIMGAFPVRYDSGNGMDISGIGRWATSDYSIAT